MNSCSVALVVSDFNSEITSIMLSTAKKRLAELHAAVAFEVHVPGAYEIPLAVSKAIAKDEVDGVIALGAVLKGGTDHDQVIAHGVAQKLLDISVSAGKPVALGIIGPNVTPDQARERQKAYARHAAETVVTMIASVSERWPKKS
ncbi:TPA: 6,7-dimethyl-8-ribityllumazine synthase [Candidatus Woesearchaeota archaeon]|nr:6,7-dimethyl-8-ribityllumazine synthase [Candidatus Woesearchaeota archaeon]HII69444.1 6,7-dimethyl-8-ribityllumazine synthase [Candidatus Woesearchaeota archaeon]